MYGYGSGAIHSAFTPHSFMGESLGELEARISDLGVLEVTCSCPRLTTL